MQFMPIRPHFAACDDELAAWQQEAEELNAVLASAAAAGRTQYAPAMNARARLAELTRLIALAEQARRGGVTVAPRSTPSVNARSGGLSTSDYAPTVPYWLRKRSANSESEPTRPSTTKLDAKEFMLPARPYYERAPKMERPATPSKPSTPASRTVEMAGRADVAMQMHWSTFSDPREMALQKMVRARPELLKQ